MDTIVLVLFLSLKPSLFRELILKISNPPHTFGSAFATGMQGHVPGKKFFCKQSKIRKTLVISNAVYQKDSMSKR